jgi:hypothetical protein
VVLLIKDQNGSISMWGIIFMAMLLVFTVWILETGKVLTILADLQTAADAASLAGAMTAEVVPQKEYEAELDDKGDITAVNEIITGWETEINKEEADREANKLFVPNLPGNIIIERANWESEVEMKNEYNVFIKDIRLKSRIESFLPEQILLGVKSKSTAVAIEEE